MLSADDLLAGANATFEVIIPPEILRPGQETASNGQAQEMPIKIRPLTIGTFQLIMKAARNDASLIPLLMIKEAIVDPVLSINQVKQMHLGLIEFLIAHIRELSGLTEKKSP